MIYNYVFFHYTNERFLFLWQHKSRDYIGRQMDYYIISQVQNNVDQFWKFLRIGAVILWVS